MKISQKCKLVLLCLAVLLCANVYAQEVRMDVSGVASTESTKPVYLDMEGEAFYEKNNLSFKWILGLDTACNYSTFIESMWGDMNVSIKEGWIAYKNDYLKFSFGKTYGQDVISSPYAMFLNPNNSLPSINFDYEDEKFFYNERWMGLTTNSTYGFDTNGDGVVDEKWPERSAVYKTYGLKYGKIKFGVQEVSVNSLNYVDLADLLIPAPSFFIQYIAFSSGRPWSQNQNTSNKNNILGLFALYEDDYWSAHAQLLVDDICLDDFLFFRTRVYTNPSKIGLTLGGDYEALNGKFGFYAAGVTKYTFQSLGSASFNYMYSYSIFPVNAYYYDGKWIPISMSDNMIGYINGENDLSFMFKWTGTPWAGKGIFGPIYLDTGLSFSLTGEQSPGNPWHEESNVAYMTQFLSDETLRKRVLLNIDAGIPIGPVAVVMALDLGYEWNKMELVYPAGTGTAALEKINGQPYFVPGTENAWIATISLGLSYTMKF